MSSIDTSVLLAPISETTPAGEDIRSSESYEKVASEIEKLTNPSGSSATDWGLVERESSQMLATQTKDFMLAAWLSAAWMERHGAEGLRAGLELHAGLVETFWQTAQPPLKRLRGRRNAFAWWLERATHWLETVAPPPIPLAEQSAMVDAARRIDHALADLDPESPPLGSFLRQLKNLNVIAEAPTTEASSTAEPSSDAAGGTSAHTPADANAATQPGPTNGASLSSAPATPTPAAISNGASAATAPTAVPAAAPTVPLARPASLATPLSTATAPALPDQLTSVNDVVLALEALAGHLSHISSALLTLDPTQPLAIDINRFAARAAILEAPPAQGGMTALIAPPAPIIDAFQSICAANNAEGMTGFCESRIPAFPFWLDLDYESARGFAMLGERGAPMHEAVVRNVLAFTARIPQIEHLAFSDGTPFASDATRAWLEECRAANHAKVTQDEFANTEQDARKSTADGRADQAILAFQAFLQRARSGRDQFRARIAMLDLLLATQGNVDAVPIAQTIFDDTVRLGLADWEPALASQALQTVLKACRPTTIQPASVNEPRAPAAYEEMRHAALQQLARIDFPAATRYMK